MSRISAPQEIFFVNPSSGRSLQSQIRETVVSAVLDRRLVPGTRLPSTRKLAEHLGVSRLTVSLAYQGLVAQGYLTSLNRSAFIVSHSAPVSHLVEPDDTVSGVDVDWGAKLPNTFAGHRRIVKPADWTQFDYPFIYGQMDMSIFDHDAWRDCVRRAIGRRDFEATASDIMEADDPVLVNYISSRTLPRRGISASPAQILVTLGAQNALWIAIQLLARNGLHAVCEDPGYPDTIAALRWSGARVSLVDVDQGGLPPERLPQDIGAVFVTPSHHAPTGVTMPMARRSQLLRLAIERDFLIVEDDYEFEMSFLAPPSPALKSRDATGRVIYVGSFSKALFPGLRLGYLVGPEPFIRAARRLRSLILRHAPGHLQRTVAYFLALGHYDTLIRKMRNVYAKRRQVLWQALTKEGVDIAGAASFGGTSLWLKGPIGTDSTKLASALVPDSVLIEAGAPFFDGSAENIPFFRLAYSSIPESRIEAGVKLISARLNAMVA